MFWLIPSGFIALIVYLIYKVSAAVENHQPWEYNFESLQFSMEEFYADCEKNMRKRKIPSTQISRVRYPEDGIGDGKRTYLHIMRHEHIFDICAAPFGAGSFVSIWYVEKHTFLHKLLHVIPVVKLFVERKTYYQADTEAVFKSAVHSAVKESIDALLATKGARMLSPEEKKSPGMSILL